MKQTINYYDQNAEAFFSDTINVDISEQRNAFLKLIQEGGVILDAGCGSGRDSRYFIERGYSVLAFDASIEMVKRSSEFIGQQTLHATFQGIELDDNAFDGIWACASLLHVNRDEILPVIAKLFRSLKPHGIFYMSFKYGRQEYRTEGRYVNCYDGESLASLLKGLPPHEMPGGIRISSDTRPGRETEMWIGCMVRKL